MADSLSFSLYNTRNIPADKIGFLYVTEILYYPQTKSLSLKYSNGTLKDLGTVDPGTARKVTNAALDVNNHLIVTFNNGTEIDVGTIMVEYNYSTVTPTGTGLLSGTELNTFKPIVSGGPNVTISTTSGITNIDAILPDTDISTGLAGALGYTNYAWFVEQWSSTAALQGPLSVANTWQTRVLNTQRINNPNLTFNNVTGEIQLPVGTYYATAIGKSYRSGVAKLAIRDITNNITLLDSMSEINYTGAASSQLTLNVRGYIKVSSPITIKLMQLSQSANSNATMGEANGTNATMGQTGTFSELNIWKIANTVLPDTPLPPSDIDAFLLELQQNYYSSGTTKLTGVGNMMGASLPSGQTITIGGCAGPDKKIYFAPYNNITGVLVIDTVTETASLNNFGISMAAGTSNKYIGACMGADGKIYIIPSSAANVAVIDTILGTGVGSTFGLTLSDSSKWTGGTMARNGKIYCAPANSTDVLVINTNNNTAVRTTFGLTLTGTTKWSGAVLGTDGKIYCIPSSSTNVMVIDPTTDTAILTNFGLDLSGSFKWYGGVLGPDGKIYCIPANATSVLIIDPINSSAEMKSFGLDMSAAGKWFGGCLGPNGKIYGTPFNGTFSLEIDPMSQTAAYVAFGFGSLGGSQKWAGGVLGENGKMYFGPCDLQNILQVSNALGASYSKAVTLSPHLNKY